ncbi:sugar ABC transporter permease [candidate division WOR-3 bacterium JGI_Cruoil_03_44_89]|uniref:Sugar ABC transporter permease n=1 Tax=candidate division WOR-3 bacterium JGI_Cruoil_03_44_89 TaxID=1973748 RepID=A0A235BPW2_UNCW3|nr:MAG: sugar ABC transporter permease [candidate division WOR-3 bacterium JGI_Cruoil_03_44_89]
MGRSRPDENNRVGYLMALPYVIFFLLFMAYPLIFSLILVFHKWNIIAPMKWVGLGNFVRLFNDALFWKSLGNTFVFLVIHIPLQIIVALVIANILNQKIAARGFFRASFFLPVVISGVVVTILWQQLYSQETGLFNALLSRMNLHKVPWLTSTKLAMPSIAIMATWKNVGLYVVLFLTGLQGIPFSLYEAADLDGASGVQKFFHITIPMLNPTMIMVLILSTLGGFSLFIEPYIMTGGGPMNSTLSCVLYIYKQAFYFNHMGYAAALAFMVALIIMVVVIIQRKSFETEVYA